jgi:hypothetical protein
MPVASTTFRIRRLVTAVLALSFFAAAVSGIVLFLRPEGSLARWTGWMIFGLDKRRWEAVHIVLVLVVLMASVAHVWLNWRPLVSSALGLASGRPATGWRLGVAPEFGVAVGIVLFALSAAILPWQPATALLGIRSLVKDGRLAARVLPPVADADRLTFREVCRVLSIDERRGIANARAGGLDIQDPSQKIAAIAERHHVTPEAVYLALSGR